MPDVTVLMPVYNGADYLKASIESILSQTFKDFEFLIINDGSTDSTEEIIQAYGDERIRLINNERNMGLTQSLNKGLKLAKGAFIARQDGDDISEPTRLEKQVGFLKRHCRIDLVGSWYKNIRPDGTVTGAYALPCHRTEIRWEIFFYCPFIHSAAMFRRRRVLKQVSCYDDTFTYAQDYDFWWRIARQLKIANIAEPLVKLRINPDSMTSTYGNVVENEPERIQRVNLQHFLAAAECEPWQAGPLLGRATTLWLAETNALAEELPEDIYDLTAWQLHEIVQEILQLHRAFCVHYRLGWCARRKHLRKVCKHLSLRLMSIANYHYYEEDEEETARLLFVHAYLLKTSTRNANYQRVKEHYLEMPFEIMT